MAPAPPRQKAATIEITVETLTGTGFRLRVSSYETVMSVKARIMRIEGVPTSQQHLIYKNRELVDTASLQESGVLNGARLKLVVAMRGGPVNTRRLPMYEDITHAEMQQLMQMQTDPAFEEQDSPGRQVTLLVFREGDQVSFYRVIENTDGTFSPLSDSWGSSLRNMFHEENPEEVKRRIDENTTTMGKVTELRRRMQEAVSRKRGRVRPPSRPTTTTSPRIHLPPVSTPSVRASASYPPSQLGDLSESFSRLAAGGGNSASRRRRAAAPQTLADAVAAARANSAASDLAEEREKMTSRGNVTSGRRRKLSLSESAELFKQLQTQRGLTTHHHHHQTTTSPGVTTPRDYAAYRRSLARLTRHQSQEVPPGGESSVELPVLFETDEGKASVALRKAPLSASSCARPRTSPSQHYSKDDTDRPRSPAVSLRPTDKKAGQLCRILSAKAVLSSANDANVVWSGQEKGVGRGKAKGVGRSKANRASVGSAEAKGVSRSSGQSKAVTLGSGVAKGVSTDNAKMKAMNGIPVKDALSSDNNQPEISAYADGDKTTLAPPPAARRTTTTTKRPRCQHCRRRLGLAGVYHCHCAGIFCVQHRYPELHHCGHDYKTEGRKMLQRANPLVTAPKLPKI